MLVDDNALKAYVESLNLWHLELAMAVGALNCFSLSSDQTSRLDDHYSDLVYILQQKLDLLVETCPFPHNHNINNSVN